MSYQPILQVAARNYARDIIQGEPVKVNLLPVNGQFGYVFNYPTYGRPRIGIVYAPGTDAETFPASKTYDWVGVRVNGKQYGWVSTKDFLIEPVVEPLPEVELVFDSQEAAEVFDEALSNGEISEAVEAAEDEGLPARKPGRPKKP